MKWIITLLGLIQFFLAASIIDGQSWNHNGRENVAWTLMFIAIVNAAHSWSRGESLLALWVKRKRLEQKQKIKGLEEQGL